MGLAGTVQLTTKSYGHIGSRLTIRLMPTKSREVKMVTTDHKFTYNLSFRFTSRLVLVLGSTFLNLLILNSVRLATSLALFSGSFVCRNVLSKSFARVDLGVVRRAGCMVAEYGEA
jgi:hypothetical protein